MSIAVNEHVVGVTNIAEKYKPEPGVEPRASTHQRINDLHIKDDEMHRTQSRMCQCQRPHTGHTPTVFAHRTYMQGHSGRLTATWKLGKKNVLNHGCLEIINKILTKPLNKNLRQNDMFVF